MVRQAFRAAIPIFIAAILPLTAQPRETLTIGPYETAKSGLLQLSLGERIEVAVESAAADIFIHAEDRSLQARDDPETAASPFQWECPRPGKYYVLVRNVSATSGTARITVQPRDPDSRSRAVTPSNYARVRLFYATDREKVASPVWFGPEPANQNAMSYGVCEVSIPRDHKMGEIESPAIWRLEFRQDPERHIVLLPETIKDLARDAFFRTVEEKASTTRQREALVFIHGFNTTFDSAIRRTGQISYDLGFQGATILFSWPSQGTLGIQAYNKDGSNAELSTDSLAALFDDLRLRAGITTIHVMAHSMGNRLLTSAMAKLANAGPPQPRFRHVAFMAPDVRVETFRQLADKFRGAADRITLYASSQDEALVASQKLNGYPRAGQGGDKIVVLPGLDTIDASTVDTSLLGLAHQYYGDSRTILSDIFLLLQGKPPQERFGLRRHASGTFWIFQP